MTNASPKAARYRTSPPSRRRQLRRAVAFVVVPAGLAASTACEPRAASSDGLERVWTSEHFVYRSDPRDASVCEGVLSTLERHFAALETALGFPWPAGEKVSYQKFPDQKALRARGRCSQFHDSCFFRELGVQTQDPVEAHELVHAYLAPLGDSHPVLEEGIAEALSCLGAPQRKAERGALDEAFAPTSWQHANALTRRRLYRLAAGFVADFVRRHGASKFLELYRRVRRGDDALAVDAAHRDVTGEALSSSWNRLDENPDPGCLRAYECAAHGSPAAEADCGGALDRVVTIHAAGPSWFGQQSRALVLGRCEGPLSASPLTPPSELTWWALPPGDHFAAPREAAGPLALEVFPLEAALGPFERCDRLEPLPVSFTGNFTLHVAQGVAAAGTVAIRLADLAQPSEPLYAVECSAGLRADFCLGCDPFSCEPACGASAAAPVRGHAGDDLVFRVHFGPSGSGTLGLRRVR